MASAADEMHNDASTPKTSPATIATVVTMTTKMICRIVLVAFLTENIISFVYRFATLFLNPINGQLPSS